MQLLHFAALLSLAAATASAKAVRNIKPQSLAEAFPDAFPGQAARVDEAANGCTANTTPMQVRLAYGGPDGMTVSWNTNQRLANPQVKYGLSANALSKSSSSQLSSTYPTSSTYNNHVTITGLDPDTTYYYTIMCGDTTNPLSFQTARTPGDGTAFTFATVGDMGTMGPDGLSTTVGTGAANPLAPGERNSIQALIDANSTIDFVWHVGDISYADAWLKEEVGGYLPMTDLAGGAKVFDRILNDFFVEVEPISQMVPYMVGAGNHEANCDNGNGKNGSQTFDASICLPGQSNFTGYRNHWRMPAEQSGGLENFWYSWDHGMVHFIQFNTETDFDNAPDQPGGEGNENAGAFAPNGTQLAWLEADLASVDRSTTPWIIAAGHRPWYVSGTACVECQTAFEALLNKYNVDVLQFGHKHLYERLDTVDTSGQPDKKGLHNPKSPMYIVNGAAGHYDGLDSLPKKRAAQSVVGIDSAYGWSRWTVHNCTHLTLEFVASGNGTVLDSATLYKKRSCSADAGLAGDWR